LPEGVQAQTLSAQQSHDEVLDAEDVIGKRIVTTRLQANVTIREENAIAALEVMSRFAANPKWLIYLPPTMSPCETTREESLLEHPAEAFAYYRSQGVPQVVCESIPTPRADASRCCVRTTSSPARTSAPWKCRTGKRDHR
jgi:protein phosphatase